MQTVDCTDLELYVFVAVTAKILHYTLLATLYTAPVYMHTHGLRNKILLHLAELYILAISYYAVMYKTQTGNNFEAEYSCYKSAPSARWKVVTFFGFHLHYSLAAETHLYRCAHPVQKVWLRHCILLTLIKSDCFTKSYTNGVYQWLALVEVACRLLINVLIYKINIKSCAIACD